MINWIVNESLMQYLEKRIKSTITDKQKLLHVYISIIQDYNKNLILSYNEYVRVIKRDFNYTATVEEVRLYFEPTIEEDIIDLQLQMNNLGIN